MLNIAIDLYHTVDKNIFPCIKWSFLFYYQSTRQNIYKKPETHLNF